MTRTLTHMQDFLLDLLTRDRYEITSEPNTGAYIIVILRAIFVCNVSVDEFNQLLRNKWIDVSYVIPYAQAQGYWRITDAGRVAVDGSAS